jgi:hypothetical protein
MVLEIQASDGALVRVHGGAIDATDPHLPPKGSWHWKTSSPGCAYVRHAGVWKKVCD